ncbi:hypothetical protein AB0D30_35340 [Streptomyces sp. NPDC048409]|uniref:hypothetical protein n=1 Tax=Streptomyces sp. NPDC048409 TaxID=3154723 RepID=UPI003416BDF8
MPTTAIVGAGLSIAKVFGGHAYDVALISRGTDELDALATALTETGIGEVFAAPSPRRPGLPARRRAQSPGSGRSTCRSPPPHTGLAMTAPKDVTLHTVRPQIDSLLHGRVRGHPPPVTTEHHEDHRHRRRQQRHRPPGRP